MFEEHITSIKLLENVEEIIPKDWVLVSRGETCGNCGAGLLCHDKFCGTCGEDVKPDPNLS